MKELGRNKVNLGQKFGSWTIIEQVENYVSGKEKQEQTQWLCKCTCGCEEGNCKCDQNCTCGCQNN